MMSGTLQEVGAKEERAWEIQPVTIIMTPCISDPEAWLPQGSESHDSTNYNSVCHPQKWIMDLNLRPETKTVTIKHKVKALQHGIRQGFLGYDTKGMSKKKKLDYIKIKNICESKNKINNEKAN